MQRNVSPITAVIVIVIVVGLAAFAWFRYSGPPAAMQPGQGAEDFKRPSRAEREQIRASRLGIEPERTGTGGESGAEPGAGEAEPEAEGEAEPKAAEEKAGP